MYFTPHNSVNPGADTLFYGFVTQDGHLGWIQIDFGGSDGDVVYLAGAFNDTPGESIHVGTVPEPSSGVLTALGLLALGAPGVRARRRRTQKSASAAV